MRFPLLAALFVLGAGCDSSVAVVPNSNVGDCGTFPAIHNEAGCPESFDPALLYTTCKEPGLRCQYPEKEFATPANVCNGPLLVYCSATHPDASDASVGEWGTPLP